MSHGPIHPPDADAWRKALRAPLAITSMPVHRPYLGGHRVRVFRGLPSNGDDHWTEEWIGSDIPAGNLHPEGHPQGLTVVSDREGRTVRLKALLELFPEAMLGPVFARRFGPSLGFVVKLISLGQPGPLHVHPDAAFAARHLGVPHGQAEAWVILEADAPQGRVPAGIGFRDAVARSDLWAALERRSRTAMEALVQPASVSPGDAWLIRPGTPHFLGAGALFLEVQEASDHSIVPEHWSIGADEAGATLGLGWERALEAFDFSRSGREAAVARARQRPTRIRSQNASQELRLLDRAARVPFDVRRLDVEDSMDLDGGRFSIVVAVAGRGHLAGEWGRSVVDRGDAFALPASLDARLVAKEAPLLVYRCLGPQAEDDPGLTRGGAGGPTAH